MPESQINPSRAILDIADFSFSIKGKAILDGITLSVNAGESVAIIGPNGAGKSTLLKCINRIYTGGKGVIRIAGRPLDAYRQKELAQKICYVPQAIGGTAPFTVREFVMMARYPFLTPFSSPSQDDARAVSDSMELVGVAQFAERSITTLSGGELQKVYIAAALAQDAGIMLLDEPATFLDPKHQDDIHTLLKVANARGATIICVSHDINTAAHIGTRIVALKDGRIVFDGTPDTIMDNDHLKQIYDKDFLFAEHPETGKPVIVPGRTAG